MVRGNNGNSVAVGLNHYLKNYCRTTVSWYADDPVEMPQVLPSVPEKVRVDARTMEGLGKDYRLDGPQRRYHASGNHRSGGRLAEGMTQIRPD